jgi:hypothetical protein
MFVEAVSAAPEAVPRSKLAKAGANRERLDTRLHTGVILLVKIDPHNGS